MFCYIDTLSENVFPMVLWYFVFHVVIFSKFATEKFLLPRDHLQWNYVYRQNWMLEQVKCFVIWTLCLKMFS
jgi:hypothetical protein